jgi:hypothetical protein
MTLFVDRTTAATPEFLPMSRFLRAKRPVKKSQKTASPAS